MALVINTNTMSLNAQRNLSSSASQLATSLQRLSSGLRINSAKDDAAGLGITSRMTAQINGLNQAARNANDGISLAQTAEGALGEIGNNLQRLRELAVQSANATNSASDRASLQAEASQLTSEITRVAAQTQFNGIKLLDGTFASQSFQVGANANQTISITSIANAQATALGAHQITMDGTVTGNTKAAATDLTGGNTVAIEAGLTISTAGGGTTGTISYAALADAKAIAAAINTAAADYGVTAVASNSATLSSIGASGDVSFTLNGSAISAVGVTTADYTSLMTAINASQGATGVVASFTTTGLTNSLTLTAADGRDISILDYANTGAVGDTAAFSGVTLTEGAADSSIKTGTILLSSSKGAMSLTGANADVTGVSTSTLASVAASSVATAAGAQNTIAIVDAALAAINSARGDLGAYQNRFSSAITNLQTTSENVSAARSRIQDADFAMETAELTRGQILQQAGIAMLAQANALPNQVLTLLRG